MIKLKASNETGDTIFVRGAAIDMIVERENGCWFQTRGGESMGVVETAEQVRSLRYWDLADEYQHGKEPSLKLHEAAGLP